MGKWAKQILQIISLKFNIGRNHNQNVTVCGQEHNCMRMSKQLYAKNRRTRYATVRKCTLFWCKRPDPVKIHFAAEMGGVRKITSQICKPVN